MNHRAIATVYGGPALNALRSSLIHTRTMARDQILHRQRGQGSDSNKTSAGLLAVAGGRRGRPGSAVETSRPRARRVHAGVGCSTAGTDRPHWRESYAGTLQDGGTVLEGYMDLPHRGDDGSLVVVYCRTDGIPAEAVNARVAHYAAQMSPYREMLAVGVRLPADAKPLFLGPSQQ